MTASSRSPLFDNARALLILIVVMGHALEGLLSREPLARGLYAAIYLWHIPAFAFLSGHLSSEQLDAKALRGMAGSVLLPLIIFQILYCAFDVFVRGQPFKSEWLYTPNWILWFLLSLLFWRLLLPLVMRFRAPLLEVIAFALVAGAVSFIGYPLSLSRTLVFFPFFVAGHLLLREQFTQTPRRSLRLGAALIFAALLAWALLIAAGVVASPNTQWLYGSSSYDKLGVSLTTGGLIRFLLSGAALLSLGAFFVLCPRGPTRLTGFGARSLAPFLLHGFVVRAAQHFGWFDALHDSLGVASVPVALLLSLALGLLLGARPIVRATEPLWNPGRFFAARVVERPKS